MNKIQEYLLKVGIKPNLMGFDCFEIGIKMAMRDRSYKKNITKKLYPDIAKSFKTSASKAERAMRHSLSRARIDKTVSEFIFESVLILGED